MTLWLQAEYRARRVWERLPVSVRRPLRRFLTRRLLPEAARVDAALPAEPTFSPPVPHRPAHAGKALLRLLVETPSLHRGGIEEFVFSLVSRIDRARFSPMIVCTESGGEIAERCREAGVPVAVLGSSPKAAYRRILDEHRIDLLNAHYSTTRLGLPLAAARGIPVVPVIHNTYTWMGPADRRRIRREDRFVTRYVAVSQAVKEYATQVWGLSGGKITCINNGVDVSRHEKLLTAQPVIDRRDLGLSTDDFVFVHSAAMDAPKGQNVILAALAALVREHPEVKVVSAGAVRDEIYFRRMSDRVRRWGLEKHFRFVGFTPHVHDLYRLSDAFLLPSLIEGYSLSMLEAAFYGLPIIATRVGGASDFLEGQPFGLLIDPPYDEIATVGVAALTRFALEEQPRHTAGLVRAMREFLSRPDYWRAQGRLAREKVVSSYDIGRTVNQYETLFHGAVSAARGES